MNRKSNLFRKIRHRYRHRDCHTRKSCNNHRTSDPKTTTRHRLRNPYDPQSLLTITDYRINIADDDDGSPHKTYSTTSSEISEPGSSSTVFRQRSRESLNPDPVPPQIPSMDRDDDCECVDICDTSVITAEEERRTSCAKSSPFIQQDSDSRCSIRDNNDVKFSSNLSAMISDYRSRSKGFDTSFIFKRQTKTEPKEDVSESTTNETTPSPKPTPSQRDDENAADYRLTKSKVTDPKYKLTDKVKKRIQRSNPILSRHVVDHYIEYGKPPFRNFGCMRDSKKCRY